MMAMRRRSRPRTLTLSVEQLQRFLASDAGKRLRNALAAGAVVSAPMLFRLPVVKRSPLLRVLELLGGAALIVKLAEALRDWDPGAPRPIVLDVDPSPPPRRDV